MVATRRPAALPLLLAVLLLAGCSGGAGSGTPAATARRTGTPEARGTLEPGGTPARATPAPATPTVRRPTPTLLALPPTATEPPETGGGQAVLFPAADGVRLRGTFYVPTGTAPFKTLILVHAPGSDRHQWDAFVPALQGAGYAVLAYDLRGWGRSDPVPQNDAYLDSLPLDVTGALAWLATRSDVDPKHVGIMGAGIGANVAFVANGSTTALRTAVLLSPASTGTALTGAGVNGFVSRDVLFVADEAGTPDAQTLYAQTRAPRQVLSVPGVRAVGVELLGQADVANQILEWLAAQL